MTNETFSDDLILLSIQYGYPICYFRNYGHVLSGCYAEEIDFSFKIFISVSLFNYLFIVANCVGFPSNYFYRKPQLVAGRILV